MKTDRLIRACLEDPGILNSLRGWLEDEIERLQNLYRNLEGAALIQHQGKEQEVRYLLGNLSTIVKPKSKE